MVRFTQKPVYTPKAKLRQGLFTEGKEWMFAETLEEYIGLYHKYPNDAVYSEASFFPELSKPLVEFVEQSAIYPILDDIGQPTGDETNNNSLYYRITEARFNHHYLPPYHYPSPTPEQYDVGFFKRFFVQKVNNISDITEIPADEYDRINATNKPGIDQGIYRRISLKWTIDGPLSDVQAANARVIAHEELNKTMLGLNEYLSDLDEFHKNRHRVTEFIKNTTY